ncbi:MAG: electron transfer flavoprotein subunit beta/FixA family protein [Dehalococcoidia bacterium]|nr:electron transfer flavoprotein subunit beta/FixA family protein [Dehalococcoidia bacterium]
MSLTILACITSAVDTQEPLEVERGALKADEAALPRVLDPADANAIEAALLLRDRLAGARVVAVSVGPPYQEVALREAIAQGVDEAVRLWDDAFAGSDCLGTARVLAAAAARAVADIVVCGDLSLDGGSGALGGQLAELLGMPLVDGVATAEFSAEGETLLTERRARGGLRTMERTPLPALITVPAGANVPRYPTVRARLKARSSPIPCWGMTELGLQPAAVGEAGSTLRVVALRRPPPDPRGLVDPGSDLPPEQRWMMAISGGVRERESALIEGEPDEVAGRLARYLEQGGYIHRAGGRTA